MPRSRYVYRPHHPLASPFGMVDVRDAGEEQVIRAIDAPLMIDRFYENTSIPVFEDGKVKQIDIGSRQKHRTFLKDRGLTTADDYDKPGGEWDRAAKERADRQQGKFPAHEDREHRETIGKIWYEVDKRGRNAKRR